MKRFVEEELGLPFKFDAMMTPRIDCSQSPLEVRLRPEEIVELDLDDPGRIEEWERFARGVHPARSSRRATRATSTTAAAASIRSRRPGGRDEHLHALAATVRPAHGQRRGRVDRLLRGGAPKKIRRVTKCTACQLKSVCGMCPANAELEAGDPETPVDFLCHVAHLRARVFGWPVPEHGVCEFCDGPRVAELESAAQALRARIGTSRSPRRAVSLRVIRDAAGPGGAAAAAPRPLRRWRNDEGRGTAPAPPGSGQAPLCVSRREPGRAASGRGRAGQLQERDGQRPWWRRALPPHSAPTVLVDRILSAATPTRTRPGTPSASPAWSSRSRRTGAASPARAVRSGSWSTRWPPTCGSRRAGRNSSAAAGPSAVRFRWCLARLRRRRQLRDPLSRRPAPAVSVQGSAHLPGWRSRRGAAGPTARRARSSARPARVSPRRAAVPAPAA